MKNKFKKFWNETFRSACADWLLFGGGIASLAHYLNGEPWYMILLMIISCKFTSDILRSPITEAKYE